MADGTPSLNPTILGRPLFPSMDKIGQALSGLRDSAQQNFGNYSTSPTMMAGAAGVNPSIASSISPIRGPLIRTDYGRPPSERPDFRNPAEQWDVRKPIQTATSGSAPQPMAPSFLSPQSQGVVSSVRQPVQKFEGLPTVEQQFPFQQYREPMAPVTAGLGGLTERVGVRTAYGMVYPTRGQEAAAQRLAQMPAMGARLAEVSKQLSQAEKIAQMKELGGKESIKRTAAVEKQIKEAKLQKQEDFNLAEQRIRNRKQAQQDQEEKVSSNTKQSPVNREQLQKGQKRMPKWVEAMLS